MIGDDLQDLENSNATTDQNEGLYDDMQVFNTELRFSSGFLMSPSDE
jgi:hypothetical protein